MDKLPHKQYRTDMHVHTAEVSHCGQVKAAKVVRMYHDAGYDGIVITDHFFEGFFSRLTGLTWKQKVDRYLSGYRKAAEAGAKVGLQILLGAEFRFTENANDYLVYGFDADFLYRNPEPYLLGLKQFHHLIQSTELLIYQAHPFRSGMVPADPRLLHGVEVYNGNPRHDSHNIMACRYAAKYQLRRVSGSDFHQPRDLGTGGIVTAEAITTFSALSRILREERIIEYLGLDAKLLDCFTS